MGAIAQYFGNGGSTTVVNYSRDRPARDSDAASPRSPLVNTPTGMQSTVVRAALCYHVH